MAMPTNVVLIRADANATMGTGHVMRCLALAQDWREAGRCAKFVLARGEEDIHERIRSEGCEVVEISAEAGDAVDAAETLNLCAQHEAEWLVLDGYHFSSSYRQRVGQIPAHLLVIDDHGAFAPYECDIVVNGNVYASKSMYPQKRGRTRFLLGPEYALLRREFLRTSRKRKAIPETATRILITMGGADPENVTVRVIEALGKIKDIALDVTVVLGASNRHRASVERAIEKLPLPAKLFVNATNMPELMAGADLAISAGGGTCDELAFLGVPMFLITIAGNQEQAVEAYGRAKAAVAAGWFSGLDQEHLVKSLRDVICDRALRSEIAVKAGSLIDGRGAQRIVEVMRSVEAVRS